MEQHAASALVGAATGSPTQPTAVPRLPSSIQRLLPEFLSSNPYFCAGFGLAGLGEISTCVPRIRPVLPAFDAVTGSVGD